MDHFRRSLACSTALATVAAVMFAVPAVAIAAAPTVISNRTGEQVPLADGGGVETVVESIALPKGSWTITSNATAIDLESGDFVRCQLQDNGTLFDGGSTVYLEATIGDLANAGVVTTHASSTITLDCDHDHTVNTVGQFYIDPGATLTAVEGGPISKPKSNAGVATRAKATPTVVQRRSTAQVPLSTSDTPFDVVSAKISAGTWVVRANLSAVSFGGFDFVNCELADSAFGNVIGDQQVVVGDSDAIVSNLSLQGEAVTTKPTTLTLICDASETTNVYIDPGATLTATLAPKASDVVLSATMGGATLSDTGGAQTTVLRQTLPAGAWRASSTAISLARNPNGGIGDATDFVRCTLLAGKHHIDGGATVLINDTDSADDGGNYEQGLLNTGTVTEKKPWKLTLSCSHDGTISGGQHWQVLLFSPIVAVQQGPIQSTVT